MFVLLSYFFPPVAFYFIFFCLGAVLRNPAQQNSTEADVEMAVRNWLRLSRDSNGGRQRRGEQAF